VVVGCGGVGSFVIPPLIKLMSKFPSPPEILLIDGDTLEEKNLDRQLFGIDDIGLNKAEALYRKLLPEYGRLRFHPHYFALGSIELTPGALLVVAVDNHRARKAALETADLIGGSVLIGANEFTDAEAYYYTSEWRSTALDPRVYFPIITSDESGDPLSPEGCTGHAAVATPQLVAANFSAADFILSLFWLHHVDYGKFAGADLRGMAPILHSRTFARYGTKRISDFPGWEAAFIS
jgi:hypothetical protein